MCALLVTVAWAPTWYLPTAWLSSAKFNSSFVIGFCDENYPLTLLIPIDFEQKIWALSFFWLSIHYDPSIIYTLDGL
ncbi:hypothetical protein BUE80_DR009106 [Diplocarpon rosae]|nr:hypothetical protein BUE80_DR009106 [Diplocarpon rosae]